MIEVETLSVVRGGRALVSGVGFTVRPGEVLALLGPNGAGKSTTLACVAGDLHPTSGIVRLAGQPIEAHAPEALAHLRAVLPQSSMLAFDFTAAEVVGLGSLDPGRRQSEVVAACLARAGMSTFAGAAYTRLSGGERQRVHFARVLCQLETRRDPEAPAALLLDEPASSLDVFHQHAVLAEMRRMADRGSIAALVVLHDLNQALRYADRVVLLSDGRVAGAGRPEEILEPVRLRAVYGVPFEVLRDRRGRYVLAACPEDAADTHLKLRAARY